MITYDQSKVDEFRKLAVTSVEDIVVGETYYSNFFPSEFTVAEVITYGDYWKRIGLGEHSRPDVIGYIIPTGIEEVQIGSGISLADNNVIDSYNPWMIFKDQRDAMRAKEEIEIGHDPDPVDDWDYDDYNDYYDQEEYDGCPS